MQELAALRQLAPKGAARRNECKKPSNRKERRLLRSAGEKSEVAIIKEAASSTTHLRRRKEPQPPCLAIQPHPSPAIRAQLRISFCADFAPRDQNYSYMHSLFDTGSAFARTPDSACTVAEDALCVLQLGTNFASKRLILGYYDLYVKAVQRLRREIERLRRGHLDEGGVGGIVAAMCFLGVCDSYAEPMYDSRGFVEHMKGLMAILDGEEGGFRGLGMSEQAVVCFEHWQYVQALGYGLVARKAVRGFSPKWDITAREDQPAITALAIKVPGILEDLESWCRNLERRPEDSLIADQVAHVLGRAFQLRNDMNRCIDRFAQQAEEHQSREVDIDEYPDMAIRLGDLADVFPHVLNFSSLLVAQVYRTNWISLLALDQAILETCRLLLDLPGDRDCTGSFHDHHIADLQLELGDSATKLAKSLPFLCAAQWNYSGSYGVLLPLHFTQQFFERAGRGYAKQLAWCQRLKENVVLGCRIRRILGSDS